MRGFRANSGLSCGGEREVEFIDCSSDLSSFIQQPGKFRSRNGEDPDWETPLAIGHHGFRRGHDHSPAARERLLGSKELSALEAPQPDGKRARSQ